MKVVKQSGRPRLDLSNHAPHNSDSPLATSKCPSYHNLVYFSFQQAHYRSTESLPASYPVRAHACSPGWTWLEHCVAAPTPCGSGQQPTRSQLLYRSRNKDSHQSSRGRLYNLDSNIIIEVNPSNRCIHGCTRNTVVYITASEQHSRYFSLIIILSLIRCFTETIKFVP